jgi:hypothetical protein
VTPRTRAVFGESTESVDNVTDMPLVEVHGTGSTIGLIEQGSYLGQSVLRRRFASRTDWMHSVAFPSAFRIFARARAAANLDWACSSARRTDSGVGWRWSWESIDWGNIGLATGFRIDRSSNASNCAISSPQMSVWADALSSPMMAQAIMISDTGGMVVGLHAVARPTAGARCSFD